jgi:hypothetical protein
MSKKVWVFFLVLGFFSLSFSGCYYFSATKEMKAAEKLLADLKAQGGEKLVPYEYCSAVQFLEDTKLEYREGDYKSAKEFASRSQSAAQAGLAEIQKKK